MDGNHFDGAIGKVKVAQRDVGTKIIEVEAPSRSPAWQTLSAGR